MAASASRPRRSTRPGRSACASARPARRGRRRSSSGSGCSISSRSKASRRGEVLERRPACRRRWRRPAAGSSAEPLANRRDGFHVPARLDLQLDPRVALVDVAADLVQQRRRSSAGMPTDTPQSALDAHRAEVRRQGLPGGAQLGVEHGHLQGGLGHRVAANRLQQAAARPRRRDVAAGEPGQRGGRAARAAPRRCTRSCRAALGRATHSPQPSPSAVVQPDQQHVPLVLDPERRAERAYQRQPAPQHLDGLDPHACLP